jgi:thiol-disulfide isomerase/thioredoxin
LNRRKMLLRTAGSLAALKAMANETAPGSELIGKPAPPLQLIHWLNSKPLEITDLRGKVVLIRWWTEGCPFCTATAPALLSLQNEYGVKGFEVIGVYHPKPPGKWNPHSVEAAVKEKQFTFPVAIDGDWTALRRWWLTQDRDYTSVSFLLDKNGIVRYIHPGGEFHEGNSGALSEHQACNRDMHFLHQEIGRLI